MTDRLNTFQWIHGAADCAYCQDPLIQVCEVDPDTYVLRISKCYSFEANFLYLLVGTERAILFDTGGPPDPQAAGQALPLRPIVDGILDRHARSPGPGGMELIVAHTHSHGDHVYGDAAFSDRARTIVVGHSLADVTAFYGLPDWPNGSSPFDLGDRALTIIPTPGHEATHVAIYDERTAILLTGDILYPGLITVRDWPAFRASARRLVEFARSHRVAAVLGNHIEMTSTPGTLYPLGTTYQPEAHALPLQAAHIEELHEACEAMADAPHDITRGSFAIAMVER